MLAARHDDDDDDDDEFMKLIGAFSFHFFFFIFLKRLSICERNIKIMIKYKGNGFQRF